MNHTEFLNIITDHKGIIYKVANIYTRNQEDRKDLVQEIILQVWRSIDRYDSEYRLSTWIYRIALNVSISAYSKSKKRNSTELPFAEEIIRVTEVDETQEANKDIAQLYAFITNLKEFDKALILLYLEEKSQKEISEILGISTTNISTKIARIKKKLQLEFSKIKSV